MTTATAHAAEFRCAVEARDGFVEQDNAGTITGPAVVLCRSLADQLASPATAARLVVVEPDTGTGMPEADVAFFSDALIDERHLTHQLRVGPAVFHDPVQVLVPDASPVRRPEDLAGRVVCVMIGGVGQAALEHHLARLSPPPIRLSFREGDEMRDAYNVGRCEAVIDRHSDLADVLAEPGVNHLKSRMLAEPLDDAPVRVAVPAGSAVRLDALKLP
ncbi:MAG: transporter substrate-binding domain-containing protein [Acetobacteraceae bacterium]|nr:transporter substrate-binding domain-containing protein [Acetobacteraceae bacterium]